MKIKNILTGTILSGAMMLSSCSLNEDLSAISNPDTFYATKAQCEAALNGTYIPLKSLYTWEYFLAMEAVTDLASCMGSNDNARALMTPAKPCFGSTAWTQGYLGVMRCNAAIAGIEKAPINEEVKAQMLAEGVIMRAFYYYYLTCFFGNVPFYEDDVATREVQDKIAVLPRMSAVETRDSLIKELEYWVPQMKQCRTSEVENNRSGAAMGWMLIAKMAMWNKNWDKAIEAIEQLEKLYGDLSQYPLEDVYFRNKNTPESIFEIQHVYVDGGLNYTNSVACVCTPTKSLVNGKALYDGIEIPELGSEGTTWTPCRPSPYMVSLLYEGSPDRRSGMWIVHSSYNGQLFNRADGCFGPKFWCPNMRNTADSNNYKVFRYADALLLKAEAYCMKEMKDESLRYLNMTKRRAGADEYEFRNWTRLMDEIMDERARELVGEFQRKLDLVRWGVWYDRTYNLNARTDMRESLMPCQEYYPIPDTEVVYSGYNLDNDAYNKNMAEK